ncbi:MAG TPA: proline--tRNA ligase, partial [Spongiibacteraceae bacterium]|nr:proline--tRNA ligase [Spongiibacteraceae bacterium]
ATQSLQKIATPNAHTIEEVSAFLKIDPQQTVKTLIVLGAEEEEGKTTPLVALVLRGDHSLNEIKAEKIKGVGKPLQFASDAQIEQIVGCKPGSLGPVGLKIDVIIDRAAAHLADFVCGANDDGYHLTGVNWERDLPLARVEDIRNVVEGDPSPDGKGKLQIKRGIEVGHIFQLGTKYSEAMSAKVLNEEGREQIMIMGCYGIGVSRVVAAAIEQNHDDGGIIWPDAIAPFQIAIVPLNAQKSETVRTHSEQLYERLRSMGYAVLLDDRSERPGVKFADIDLIGIPHRIVIGERSLADNKIEYKHRREPAAREIALTEIDAFLQQNIPLR